MRKLVLFIIFLLILVPVASADPISDWFRSLFGITGRITTDQPDIIITDPVSSGQIYVTSSSFAVIRGTASNDVRIVKVKLGDREWVNAFVKSQNDMVTWTAILRLDKDDATYSVQAKAYSGSGSKTDLITIKYSLTEACPDPTYPRIKWDRVWCSFIGGRFMDKVGDSPDEMDIEFDSKWGNFVSVGGIQGNLIGFKSGRKINFELGQYEFTLGSDDGSKLFIDGVEVINNWGVHGYQTKKVTKTLSGDHNLRIDFYENTGIAHVSFNYEKISEIGIITDTQVDSISIDELLPATIYIDGSIDVIARASDSSGIKEIEIYDKREGFSDRKQYTCTFLSGVSNICKYTFTARFTQVDKQIKFYAIATDNNDNTRTSSERSLTVVEQIGGENQAPTASSRSSTTNQDTSKLITLSCSDPESDPLTYSVVSSPSSGTLTGSGRSKTYNPNPGFHGSDSFSYKCIANGIDSNIATVTITVNQVTTTATKPTITLNPPLKDIAEYSVNNNKMSIRGEVTSGSRSRVSVRITYASNLIFDGVSGLNSNKIDLTEKQIMVILNRGRYPLIILANNIGNNKKTIKTIYIDYTPYTPPQTQRRGRGVCSESRKGDTFTSLASNIDWVCVCDNSGCGWKDESEISDTQVPEPTLSSITVSPSSPNVNVDSEQTFRVVAHYSDNSQSTLTSGVTLASLDTSVAIIRGSKAIGILEGTVTIRATYEGMTDDVILTVIPKPAVTPIVVQQEGKRCGENQADNDIPGCSQNNNLLYWCVVDEYVDSGYTYKWIFARDCGDVCEECGGLETGYSASTAGPSIAMAEPQVRTPSARKAAYKCYDWEDGIEDCSEDSKKILVCVYFGGSDSYTEGYYWNVTTNCDVLGKICEREDDWSVSCVGEEVETEKEEVSAPALVGDGETPEQTGVIETPKTKIKSEPSPELADDGEEGETEDFWDFLPFRYRGFWYETTVRAPFSVRTGFREESDSTETRFRFWPFEERSHMSEEEANQLRHDYWYAVDEADSKLDEAVEVWDSQYVDTVASLPDSLRKSTVKEIEDRAVELFGEADYWSTQEGVLKNKAAKNEIKITVTSCRGEGTDGLKCDKCDGPSLGGDTVCFCDEGSCVAPRLQSPPPSPEEQEQAGR